ncbi:hypothetical protein SDC9_169151 [bioreactor metagenome]|uniref:DsrE/DsrF-like family protein n=1 Tax=bioreactor metagenome TaxID=1076179 RepID=A0A645G4H7_9ZZZZ
MMKKYLFYAMRGQKMCFVHVLLNGLDLKEAGNEVKIIFEGEAVKLPPVLAQEANPLYKKALDAGLIAGVCLACSQTMGVKEEIEGLKLPLLNDMNGHAGLRPYSENGYEILVF